jgi:hypothetical protein
MVFNLFSEMPSILNMVNTDTPLITGQAHLVICIKENMYFAANENQLHNQ